MARRGARRGSAISRWTFSPLPPTRITQRCSGTPTEITTPWRRRKAQIFRKLIRTSAECPHNRYRVIRTRSDLSISDRRASRRPPIQPIASNGRGFVEEWLSMPWSEAQGFLAQEAAQALQQVHDQFDPPVKEHDTEFVRHSYGPVRGCNAPKTFQVQINSTLERVVPSKPGGESSPLPTRYFHVRETGNGYLMVSARTEPDSTCTGPNLMPANND